MDTHWDRYHRHWSLLGPPLRPTSETVALFGREIEAADADMVLLGTTPELTRLGRTMLAVDSSAAMIGALWPGDTASHRAVVGDWLQLPVADATMDAAIGDGTPSNVASSGQRRAILAEICRILRPGGRASFRLFAAPEHREPLEAISADALAGRIANFHALKWRVAMAIAGDGPDSPLPVTRLRTAIETMFPDRAALSAATGWDIDEIHTVDVYRDSGTVYSFAPLPMLVDEARSFFHDVRVVPTFGYPLAERCPLLVMRDPKHAGPARTT